MWIEPSRKFDSVLNILFKVVKFRSLERLERKREKILYGLTILVLGLT